MTFTHALATNNYGPAKFIVDASAANGTHTTIAAALTSASSGDTIAIRPGTYTENLTLKAGVNLVAYGPTFSRPSSTTVPNVIISGKATFTAAGTVGIEGICLKTNSDFALSVTGSAASIVNLSNCYINCSNNTGIQFTSSSSSSRIGLNNCAGDLGTTGIAIYTHSGAGDINMVYCNFYNTGLSTTNNTSSSSGNILPNHSHIENGCTMSGSGQFYGVCNELVMPNNQTCLTLSSTAVASAFFTVFVGNTSSAISVGSGTTCAIHNCLVSSSNATTIAGSGTLQFTNITCNSGASLDGTLTLSNASMNSFISGAGIGTSGQVFTSNGVSSPPTWQSITKSSFSAFLPTTTTNSTGDGTSFTIGTGTAWTEIFDLNNDFNTNGTFTAPVTGKYLFAVEVGLTAVGTGHTNGNLALVTSNRTWRPTNAFNPANQRASDNQGAANGSMIVDMDAADTATLQVQISNSTKTVGITGNNAGFCVTYYTGELIQ